MVATSRLSIAGRRAAPNANRGRVRPDQGRRALAMPAAWRSNGTRRPQANGAALAVRKGGGDAEHESGTPTPQMPIFRAHVRCALRPGRMCDALARSACELVHTAGGGISAIGGDMREHVLLFCLLGLVLTATIILVTAPEAVTWALSLVE